MTLSCCPWAVVPILPVLPTLFAALVAVFVAVVSAIFSLRHPQTVYRLAVFLWRQKWALLAIVFVAVMGYRATRSLTGDSTIARKPIDDQHRWTMDRGDLLRLGRSPGSREPSSRELIWEFQPRGTTFVSSPTVVGDQVFIVGSRNDRGTIYCLDANTGQLNWSCRPDGYRATFSSPVIDRGLLFVGEGFHHVRTGRLVCVDLQNEPGKVRWTFSTNGHVECTPVIVDDRVYFGAGDDGVYCLRIPEGMGEDAEIRWHVSGPKYADAETALAVHAGCVYVGLGVGGQSLVALDADTGRESARLSLPYPVFSPPAIDGGKLFVGMGVGDYVTAGETPAGQVCCVDLSTLQIDWTLPLDATVLGAISVLPEGLLFGASDGRIYRLRRDGTDVGSHALASPILNSLAVGDDRLYVLTEDGQLHCLTIDGLHPVWNLPVATAGGRCIASPLLADGSVFVASETGGLLRIGRPADPPPLDTWSGPGGRPGAVGCDSESRVGTEAVRVWSRQISSYLDGTEGTVAAPMARAGGALVLPVRTDQTDSLIALEIGPDPLPAGSIRWRTDTAGRIAASPLMSGGRVVVLCQPNEAQTGVLQCLDLSRGSILWQTPVAPAADAKTQHSSEQDLGGQWRSASTARPLDVRDQQPHEASMSVFIGDAEGMIVQCGGQQICCFDWDGRRQSMASPGLVQQIAVAKPTILVAAVGDPARLVAWDRPTGASLWEVSLEHPVTVGIVPLSDSLLLGTEAGLERRSLIDGRILGTAYGAGGVASEIWCDGVELLYCSDARQLVRGRLPELSLTTMHELPGIVAAPIVAADGLLFADGHRLFRVDRVKPDAPAVWYTLPEDQKMTAPMLLTGNHLFVVTNGRIVHCLTASGG